CKYGMLDHDDFGSNRSKVIVIDSNILERDAGGKPLHTFPHPALVMSQIATEPDRDRGVVSEGAHSQTPRRG
ncbi:MAG: hypothetical protein J0H17_16600, partial [Rhizobiales bacterium]|nr:hypothetical protein [Hyphomicrobiales bacterium]